MPLGANNVNIHNQVMAMLALQGWSLTKVVKEMNARHPERKNTTVQNISNKLTRGTIKYSEVLEIAEIIGTAIEWGPAAFSSKTEELDDVSLNSNRRR